MKAVHILTRIDREVDLLRIDVRWQRQLHDVAVDLRIVVQLLHKSEQLILTDRRRPMHQRAFETRLLAGLHLVLHIRAAGTVLAHEHRGQVRCAAPFRGDRSGLLSNALPDRYGGRLSIEQLVCGGLLWHGPDHGLQGNATRRNASSCRSTLHAENH